MFPLICWKASKRSAIVGVFGISGPAVRGVGQARRVRPGGNPRLHLLRLVVEDGREVLRRARAVVPLSEEQGVADDEPVGRAGVAPTAEHGDAAVRVPRPGVVALEQDRRVRVTIRGRIPRLEEVAARGDNRPVAVGERRDALQVIVEEEAFVGQVDRLIADRDLNVRCLPSRRGPGRSSASRWRR
jgi:hypothetical protein